MVGSGGAAPTRGQDEDVRVRVRADDGTFSLPLQRLGRSAPFAGAAMLRSSTARRRNHEVAARPHEGRTPVPDIPNQRVHRALRHDRPGPAPARAWPHAGGPRHPHERHINSIYGELQVRGRAQVTVYIFSATR
jgi:hypothetical protein